MCCGTGGPGPPPDCCRSPCPTCGLRGSLPASSTPSLCWPGPRAGNRGQPGRQQSAAAVARGGAEATLGLTPDTRRGSGAAARPPPLALPHSPPSRAGTLAEKPGRRHPHGGPTPLKGGSPGPRRPHPPLTCVLTANPLRKRTSNATTALLYRSPPPSGRGRSQHTTPLSQFAPRWLPGPRSARPSPTAGDCGLVLSRRPAIRPRRRLLPPRWAGTAVPGWEAGQNLATVPGIPRGEGDPSFCMNYSRLQSGVGR